MVNIDKVLTLAKAKGITQKSICLKLGKGLTYLADVKRGQIIIPDQKAELLADILGTTPEYLTDKTDTPTPPQTVTDLDIKVALFGGDGEVTDEMWEEVKQFAAFVKQKNQKK